MNRAARRVHYRINKMDEKWLEERIDTINPHKKMYNFVYDELFDMGMGDILLKFIKKYGLRPDIVNFEDFISGLLEQKKYSVLENVFNKINWKNMKYHEKYTSVLMYILYNSSDQNSFDYIQIILQNGYNVNYINKGYSNILTNLIYKSFDHQFPYPDRKKDIFFNRKKFELILSYFHKDTLNNVIFNDYKPIELLIKLSIIKMKHLPLINGDTRTIGSIIPKTSITILNLLIKYGAEVKYIKRISVRIMIRNVLAFNQHYKQRKIIHKMYKILINNGLDTSISSFIRINDRLIRTNLLEVSFLVNNFRLAKLLLQSGSAFRNSYQLCLDKAIQIKNTRFDKRLYDLITGFDKPLNINWKTQKTDSPCKIIWTPRHLNIANTLILMTKKHPVTLHGYNSDSIPLDRLGETGIWSKIIEYAVDWRD